MKTEICFIRHGQTDWNKHTRIQGTINNKLNETGRYQAHTLGKYLKEHDFAWDVIIASPLLRAYETAQIIHQELGKAIPLIIEPSFTEREFGKAEGETISTEIFNKIVADQIDGLEKSTDLQKRVYETTLKMARQFIGKRILVVAHSHVIKGLLTKLDNKYSFRDKMDNSALNFFSVVDDIVTIDKFNVSTHLKKD